MILPPDLEASGGGKNKQQSWKRKSLNKHQRQALKAWYGPVDSAEECKAEQRTNKVILKSEMKPAEICKNVSTSWN